MFNITKVKYISKVQLENRRGKFNYWYGYKVNIYNNKYL